MVFFRQTCAVLECGYGCRRLIHQPAAISGATQASTSAQVKCMAHPTTGPLETPMCGWRGWRRSALSARPLGPSATIWCLERRAPRSVKRSFWVATPLARATRPAQFIIVNAMMRHFSVTNVYLSSV